jgi:hypothetical protein
VTHITKPVNQSQEIVTSNYACCHFACYR